MARQAIGIGTTANDGTGDTDRAAWTKVNTMTTELYARIPAYTTGKYYWPYGLLGSSYLAGQAMAVNIGRFIPVFNPVAITIDQLVCRVNTAGTNVQVALYNDNNGRPGTEICHTGNIDATTTGMKSAALSTGTTAVIPAGLIWMGVNCDNALVQMATVNTAAFESVCSVGSATLANLSASAASVGMFVTTPLTFGTWGDLTSATWTDTNGSNNAIVGFRVA